MCQTFYLTMLTEEISGLNKLSTTFLSHASSLQKLYMAHGKKR
jgi:hypothetical protein